MRYGLIGCGVVGALRAAALAAPGPRQLVAVSDVDAGRARAAAEPSGATIETDWRALVRRDDVDAVVVSTPPALHVEMCVTALQNGKHVLAEKPLARNPSECEEIVDAALAAGKVLATGFNYRFYPAIVTAKRVLDSGEIGELDHIRSFAGHPGGEEFTQPWVHDVSAMGGGALMDNGIHLIDLTHYFLGDVVEVSGVASGHVWKFPGCEDNGFALMRNADGKIASLHASWTEWRGYRFYIEVFGTKGMVRASYPPMLTTVRTREARRPRVHLFPLFQIKERLRSYRWTAIQSFVDEFSGFERAVGGETSNNALGHDGLMAVRIAHTVYASSRNNCNAVAFANQSKDVPPAQRSA